MNPPRSGRVRVWSGAGAYALLLLMLVYLIGMLDRSILAVLLQPIK
jgi:hypothetical protein